MANVQEINAMGQADQGEGVELNAFISNRGELWVVVERAYRNAEMLQRHGEYVSEYLEAELFAYAVSSGARLYCREYCGTEAKMVDIFTLDARRSCAKMLVENFESERAAGNYWS